MRSCKLDCVVNAYLKHNTQSTNLFRPLGFEVNTRSGYRLGLYRPGGLVYANFSKLGG